MISVIVPIYNTQEYLSKCLQSIINQTYKDLEIILINDGSTDSTLEICKRYSETDKRIKIINQKNQGVSTARNSALKIAKGDYIAFVDSDDYIKNNMFEILKDSMERNKCDISICDFIIEKTETCEEKSNIIEKVMTPKEGIKNMLLNDDFGGHVCNKLYKRSLFSNIKFDKEIKICEDLLINVEMFLKSNSVVYTSQKLYYYVTRMGSATNNQIFSEQSYTSKIAYQKIEKILANDKDLLIYSKYFALISNYNYIKELKYSSKYYKKKYLKTSLHEFRKNFSAYKLMASNKGKLKLMLIYINVNIYYAVFKFIEKH